MDYSNIIVENDGPIAVITINRPNRLNALNKQTIAELHAAISAAASDTGTGAIILTGAGEKAFAAGADIAEFAAFGREQGRELAETGHATLFNTIENLAKPVIAAINGFALGGGLELALASHLRIAATSAKMGLPETRLGLIPGYGGTQRLPLLAGKGKALEMILTGEMIDAAEAYRIGLVNQLTEPGELLAAAKKMAQQISRRSPAAVAAAIAVVNKAGTPEGFAAEIDAFATCFSTGDFKDGVSAFLEKREPGFARRFEA